MIADEQWLTKVKQGREKDIRRCVAANYCWRSVVRGSRVQCAYNPVVGREAIWGANATGKTYSPKRVLVIGAGPAGLEYARVASGQGNAVVVYEREQAVGGHVRAYGALPYREQYGTIATWLAAQASGNGTAIKLECPITARESRRDIDCRKARPRSGSHRRRLPTRRLSGTDRQAHFWVGDWQVRILGSNCARPSVLYTGRGSRHR